MKVWILTEEVSYDPENYENTIIGVYSGPDRAHLEESRLIEKYEKRHQAAYQAGSFCPDMSYTVDEYEVQ